MTTRVTVKNEAESHHNIQLTFAGQNFVVAPGDSLTTHIWAENGITITELPIAKPSQPDASEAKVYRKLDDGTYEELPQVNTTGVPVPTGFLGLTPIQFKAKRLYDAYSANHPTIHCNRFAPWEELSTDEQYGWIVRAGQP